MVDRRDAREDITRLQFMTDRILEDTKMEREVVQKLKDDVDRRFDKLDNRLRLVERNMYYAIGALAVLQFALKFVHS